MIIDSHCHAWRVWPDAKAPDRDTRTLVEQLLFEMDSNGVDQATIVCARVEANPDNNDYIAACVKRYPDRLHQLADIDSFWTDTYHVPGAAARLLEATERYGLRGFTHYLREDDDGSWLLSDEGTAFFETAEKLRLIASLYLMPAVQASLRRVAERFPSVPFLVHHMGWVKAAEEPPYPQLKEVLASARVPNIFIKMSGFHYASSRPWEYPYPDCRHIVYSIYEHFGPDRLCWGSDYPMVRPNLSYKQSLEAFRIHCPFIPEEHMARILGGNLHRLLVERGAQTNT